MSWDWDRLQKQRSQQGGGKGLGNRPPELDELKRMLSRFSQHKFSLVGAAIALIALLWLASGFYIVSPGQVGLEQRFGALEKQTSMGAGLQWHWPWPIEQASVVDVQKVRSFELGFRRPVGDAKQVVRDEALMLTKDKNMAHLEIIIHYRVQEPSKYLFEARYPEEWILETSAESSIRSVVGTHEIDEVIVAEGLARVADRTLELLQELLNDYNSGLSVTDVRIERGDAPVEVRDSFHDVVRAMEDKERLIYKAEEYREDIVPRARGERERRILTALGDIQRFSQHLEEYRKAEEVTRLRLYLETMGGEVLPKVNKMIIDEDATDTILTLPEGGKLDLENIEER